jgi:hypothetical protein
MANSVYFKSYVDQLNRMRVETAHDQHILEFRAMCAKMIEEAIPVITARVKEECMRELRQYYKLTEQPKQQEVKVIISAEKIKTSVIEAIKRAFKR